jgi:MoaE-MoaD fusion protein
VTNNGERAIATSTEERFISVRVLFFGAAREAAELDETIFDLHAPATTRTAFTEIVSAYPQLARFGRSLLIAVNEEYAPEEQAIRDNDTLALFPPVSGGSDTAAPPDQAIEDFFELTTDLINIGEVARRVVPPSCGATVTLDGYVREWTRGRQTHYLVYEAYEPMALSEMRKLGERAREQFDIAHIGIVHRTGRLEIGETSVVISVSAPHRSAAFEACQWLISELKRTVPIWKKEFYADGEMWVEGEGAQYE